jgi:uncharacterized protein (TIGR02246 family)
VPTIEAWIEGYRIAWEERDPQAAADLFTEDATYRSNIFETPHRGRTGVADYWAGVTEAQSDITVRMGRPFVDGDRVAVEFWANMKVAGDDVTLPGCLLLQMADDGRCERLREYWHYQEGSFDPPTEWGG